MGSDVSVVLYADAPVPEVVVATQLKAHNNHYNSTSQSRSSAAPGATRHCPAIRIMTAAAARSIADDVSASSMSSHVDQHPLDRPVLLIRNCAELDAFTKSHTYVPVLRAVHAYLDAHSSTARAAAGRHGNNSNSSNATRPVCPIGLFFDPSLALGERLTTTEARAACVQCLKLFFVHLVAALEFVREPGDAPASPALPPPPVTAPSGSAAPQQTPSPPPPPPPPRLSVLYLDLRCGSLDDAAAKWFASSVIMRAVRRARPFMLVSARSAAAGMGGPTSLSPSASPSVPMGGDTFLNYYSPDVKADMMWASLQHVLLTDNKLTLDGAKAVLTELLAEDATHDVLLRQQGIDPTAQRAKEVMDAIARDRLTPRPDTQLLPQLYLVDVHHNDYADAAAEEEWERATQASAMTNDDRVTSEHFAAPEPRVALPSPAFSSVPPSPQSGPPQPTARTAAGATAATAGSPDVQLTPSIEASHSQRPAEALQEEKKEEQHVETKKKKAPTQPQPQTQQHQSKIPPQHTQRPKHNPVSAPAPVTLHTDDIAAAAQAPSALPVPPSPPYPPPQQRVSKTRKPAALAADPAPSHSPDPEFISPPCNPPYNAELHEAGNHRDVNDLAGEEEAEEGIGGEGPALPQLQRPSGVARTKDATPPRTRALVSPRAGTSPIRRMPEPTKRPGELPTAVAPHAVVAKEVTETAPPVKASPRRRQASAKTTAQTSSPPAPAAAAEHEQPPQKKKKKPLAPPQQQQQQRQQQMRQPRSESAATMKPPALRKSDSARGFVKLPGEESSIRTGHDTPLPTTEAEDAATPAEVPLPPSTPSPPRAPSTPREARRNVFKSPPQSARSKNVKTPVHATHGSPPGTARHAPQEPPQVEEKPKPIRQPKKQNKLIPASVEAPRDEVAEEQPSMTASTRQLISPPPQLTRSTTRRTVRGADGVVKSVQHVVSRDPSPADRRHPRHRTPPPASATAAPRVSTNNRAAAEEMPDEVVRGHSARRTQEQLPPEPDVLRHAVSPPASARAPSPQVPSLRLPVPVKQDYRATSPMQPDTSERGGGSTPRGGRGRGSGRMAALLVSPRGRRSPNLHDGEKGETTVNAEMDVTPQPHQKRRMNPDSAADQEPWLDHAHPIEASSHRHRSTHSHDEGNDVDHNNRHNRKSKNNNKSTRAPNLAARRFSDRAAQLSPRSARRRTFDIPALDPPEAPFAAAAAQVPPTMWEEGVRKRHKSPAQVAAAAAARRNASAHSRRQRRGEDADGDLVSPRPGSTTPRLTSSRSGGRGRDRVAEARAAYEAATLAEAKAKAQMELRAQQRASGVLNTPRGRPSATYGTPLSARKPHPPQHTEPTTHRGASLRVEGEVQSVPEASLHVQEFAPAAQQNSGRDVGGNSPSPAPYRPAGVDHTPTSVHTPNAAAYADPVSDSTHRKPHHDLSSYARGKPNAKRRLSTTEPPRITPRYTTTSQLRKVTSQRQRRVTETQEEISAFYATTAQPRRNFRGAAAFASMALPQPTREELLAVQAAKEWQNDRRDSLPSSPRHPTTTHDGAGHSARSGRRRGSGGAGVPQGGSASPLFRDDTVAKGGSVGAVYTVSPVSREISTGAVNATAPATQLHPQRITPAYRHDASREAAEEEAPWEDGSSATSLSPWGTADYQGSAPRHGRGGAAASGEVNENGVELVHQALRTHRR